MGDDLYVQFLFLVFAGIFLGLSLFYSAYRIQKKRGVVTESNIGYVLMLLISSLQLLQALRLEVNPVIWYGIFIGILVISLISRFYFNGRDVTFYETTKESVVSLLDEELTNLSIPFEIKDDNLVDETIVDLYQDQVKIKVVAGMWGDKNKTITVSFKKWWRLPLVEEIQYRIIDVYRQQREGKLFWKQMVWNGVVGLGIFVAMGYFAWSMYPELS
ncbi:hypothetical protein [Aquibacillus sediminis]|uniref:hypothetical protein n=1 Tax=Aquibacillus sediminis TaxID=2574734 RepID=UPI0011092DF9|nr:hypothetical protein [Aquibacillus sediminis]